MLKLARYGGLSHKKQKSYGRNNFHSPPEKVGLFTFLYPYIDWFLIGGNFTNNNDLKIKSFAEGFNWETDDNFKNKHASLTDQAKYRICYVDGYVWTHMLPKEKLYKYVLAKKGSWYKVHSSNIDKFITLEINTSQKFQKQKGWGIKSNIQLNSMYGTSTDHLEIFVPKTTKIY